MTKNISSNEIRILRVFGTVLTVCLILIVSFYFLAGDQILIRESRGNFIVEIAGSSAAELCEGAVIEQVFHAKIQRLENISVRFGTYYRVNSGTVCVQLFLDSTDELLMEDSFDASQIGEGQFITIHAPAPIETVNDLPLRLRLTADSLPGCAITPMINADPEREGFHLFVNGEPFPGTLCFSAGGTDYIWAGLHYWAFAAAFSAALLLLFTVVWLRWRSGKHSYIVNALFAIQKYRFLIRQLVSRDFKTKYKRSVLGVFWSFLNPLLMMIVQYFVFSTVFNSDIPHFAAYLIIGTVMFNFFSESCGMTLNSILGNAGLITKVYMPKYIYPLTRTISSVINLAISLIPLTIVCFVTGVHLQKAAVLSIFFFACVIVFCLGLGMLLATSMVFFRDTQFLWGVLSMMWMYATPIFYPETIVPDNLRFVLLVNPLYHFLQGARMCILNGLSPEPIVYMRCMLIALAMLLVGAAAFYKNQDKFVLYL